nr:DciA family protein [Nigerium massiliense]
MDAVEKSDFDPTGLDLARSIAEAVSHTAPLPKPREQRRRAAPRRASTRRSKQDPMALGEALEGFVAERGWQTEVNVHLLLGRWASLVGASNAEHSRPESFTAGVVTIRTDSSAWASQLRLMTPQLLAKLNASLGDGTINKIVIKGPDAPSWKHGRRSVSDGRGPRDTYG